MRVGHVHNREAKKFTLFACLCRAPYCVIRRPSTTKRVFVSSTDQFKVLYFESNQCQAISSVHQFHSNSRDKLIDRSHDIGHIQVYLMIATLLPLSAARRTQGQCKVHHRSNLCLGLFCDQHLYHGSCRGRHLWRRL